MRRAVVSALSTILLTGCSLFGVRSGYEEPRYEVVDRIDGAIEVRRYAPRLAAETVVSGPEEEAVRDEAFRILFDYISGANRADASVAMTVPVETAARGESITMTAPVETAAADGRYAMRFFLPSSYTRASVPQPTDPRVRIVTFPETISAVLSFNGSTSPGHVASQQERLLRALESSIWRPTGPPAALFYDPPWTIPFLRRNEIAVPVAEL